jgi:anti-anti-sigma factor
MTDQHLTTPHDRDDAPAHARVERGHRDGELIMSGEFDRSVSSLLGAALASIALECPYVHVDVRAVTFIDASTVHVLRDAQRALTEAGGSLRVWGATGICRRVLEVCDTYTLLCDGDPADGPR